MINVIAMQTCDEFEKLGSVFELLGGFTFTCCVTLNFGAYPLLHVVVKIWQSTLDMRQHQLVSTVPPVQPAVASHQIRVSGTAGTACLRLKSEATSTSSLRQAVPGNSVSQQPVSFLQSYSCLHSHCTAEQAVNVGCATQLMFAAS